MPQLEWKDVLDIGQPELDKQHKQLIALSNSLLQAMINGMGSDVLEDIFKELLDYTNIHFAAEEEYMEEIGFPGLALQQEDHAKLTAEVIAFRDRILAGDTVSPNEALDFLNDWILKHIMEMDSKIGIFAKSLS